MPGDPKNPQQPESCLRLVTPDDRLTGTLCVDPGLEPGALAPETICAFLDVKAVPGRARDDDAITAIIEKCQGEPDKPHETIIARGTPAVDGDDATFSFAEHIYEQQRRITQRAEALKNKDKADQQEETGEPADGIGGVDFYNQSAFVIARPGEVIGRFTPKTDGADGEDIFGSIITATPGRDCPVRVDRSVRVDEQGQVVAIDGGLVTLSDNKVSVEKTLAVREPVSFATGNIDFPGDVKLSKGVRDRFVVHATGDVTIDDLVGAATIGCEGSLNLRRGMAGRETGTIRVGGDLHAHYLDAINGTVCGSCVVDREVTNCTLGIEGSFESPSCMIRGGSVGAARRVEIAGLGSEAGAVTELTVGVLPELARLAGDAIELLKLLDHHSSTGAGELAALQTLPKRTAIQIEQLMELEFAKENSEQLRLKLRVGIDRLIDTLGAHTIVSVTARSTIHAGSTIVLPGWRVEFERDVSGPVLVELDESGTPVYGAPSGSSRTPLRTAAKVTPDDDTPSLAMLVREVEGFDRKLAA